MYTCYLWLMSQTVQSKKVLLIVPLDSEAALVVVAVKEVSCQSVADGS